MSPATSTAASALREHWPEYLIEGWALATFMISASVFTIWFESPDMPLHRAIAEPDVRRAFIGIAMGATAVALIYSPWGKRSGAHMNPAVTLAFLSLRRIAKWDAVFYILAQFLGGALGVALVWLCYGRVFSEPPVGFIETLPGSSGQAIAFAAELLIAFITMFSILMISGAPRLARFTGLVAGALVSSYVTFEAPLSGFSMNPARTFASALPAGNWHALWIYFSAPLLGMLAGTRAYLHIGDREQHGCAKLQHTAAGPCIHCGKIHHEN